MTDSAQTAFWKAFSQALDGGANLLMSLQEASAKVSEFDPVAVSLIWDIKAKKPLSEAMARHEGVFSPAVLAMVRAGEQGGVLDICIRRIVEGQSEGSFLLTGATPAPGTEAALFFLAFGRLLSSGVPILDVLELAVPAGASQPLRQAVHLMRQTILAGGALEQAMRRSPAIFGEEVCAAISKGEEQGELDIQAMRVGLALKSGDLSSLGSESPASVEESHAQSAATTLIGDMLRRAAQDRVTDIHLDPTDDGRGRVRFRIDGSLHDITLASELPLKAVINRLKVMVDMDITEHRLPQDGRATAMIDGRPITFRASSFPTILGERLVLRMLSHEAVTLGLEHMSFSEAELEQMRRLSKLPSGVVLCSGPNGSGKTTLMYGMVMEAATNRTCIVSVEDPVEFRLPGVAQMEVRPQAGLTFSRALRHVLNQDPDVVMIGEIRDLETLQAIMTCAVTGHLVLSQLHAATGPAAIKRMLDVGVEPFMLNSALAAVVAQRLVRSLCPNCKQKAEPPLHSLPPEAVEAIRQTKGGTFYDASPTGCEACRGNGYNKRLALHEILIMDDSMRKAIVGGADVASLRAAAIASGVKSLLIDGVEKASEGRTSIAEVLRVVPPRSDE